jgi:hypothetical protein
LISPTEHIIDITIDDFQEYKIQLTGTNDLGVDLKLFEEEHDVIKGLIYGLVGHLLGKIQLNRIVITL